MTSYNKKNTQGFTLIELMIVVVVIGILAAIAYPSFAEQVRKTRRTNAQSDLVELASFMERYYTRKFTYIGAALPFKESPKEGNTKYYDLILSPDPTAITFTLVATPKNGQDADRCGRMTVTHTGDHSAVPTDCW